ncbi:hypothetical protein SAMN05519104_7675 [Rhizobiales bacterium GAS188]|nr:hypothetical protein SAMN05519104_7675 [Rhizobiales bacterium GAS188]
MASWAIDGQMTFAKTELIAMSSGNLRPSRRGVVAAATAGIAVAMTPTHAQERTVADLNDPVTEYPRPPF